MLMCPPPPWSLPTPNICVCVHRTEAPHPLVVEQWWTHLHPGNAPRGQLSFMALSKREKATCQHDAPPPPDSHPVLLEQAGSRIIVSEGRQRHIVFDIARYDPLL